MSQRKWKSALNQSTCGPPLLYSGCREQEVAHVEVCDLDSKTGTLHVQPKPSRKWKIKDKEDRFIPFPAWLAAKLLAAKAGTDAHELLFTNSDGNVEGHFLRKIRRLLCVPV
jgi:integrase